MTRTAPAVFAIDPGPERSAWLVFDDGKPVDFEIAPNDGLVTYLRALGATFRADVVVIEKVESFGMAVGAEVFATVHWAGRFTEAVHPSSRPLLRLALFAARITAITVGIIVAGVLVAAVLRFFISAPRGEPQAGHTWSGATSPASADGGTAALLGAPKRLMTGLWWPDLLGPPPPSASLIHQAVEEARPATAPTAGVLRAIPVVARPSTSQRPDGDPSTLRAGTAGGGKTVLPPADFCADPCSVVIGTPVPPDGPKWGIASWYSDHGRAGFYAALPHWNGRPVPAVVCTFPDGRSNCLTVLIVDSCQCYVGTAWEKAIDLSPAAFSAFAPLSAGIVKVQITVLR